ncbi:EamA family transporter [Methylovirgula sp. 4M-Z18]|uniref:EamA family transporter n=1 Tax=Methylovirgula sp. 4M-Z18 TaxID=2293567 RepID=UPI000E2FF01B|nr:EamA family transporter [Methylovirgula sp. 4M-Z18]RFB81054.1 EamA family transporter [Methylovirgula sp. 4M-Z18]
MRKFFLIGFFALVVFDTMGQVGFKLTGEASGPIRFSLDWFGLVLRQPTFWMIVAAYLLAFFTYMSLLKEAPIGPLFAASHLELVTVSFISIYLFHETLGTMQFLGCGLIVAGVVILGLTEKPDNS